MGRTRRVGQWVTVPADSASWNVVHSSLYSWFKDGALIEASLHHHHAVSFWNWKVTVQIDTDMAIEISFHGEGKISSKKSGIKGFPWCNGEKRCAMLHTIKDSPTHFWLFDTFLLFSQTVKETLYWSATKEQNYHCLKVLWSSKTKLLKPSKSYLTKCLLDHPGMLWM